MCITGCEIFFSIDLSSHNELTIFVVFLQRSTESGRERERGKNEDVNALVQLSEYMLNMFLYSMKTPHTHTLI